MCVNVVPTALVVMSPDEDDVVVPPPMSPTVHQPMYERTDVVIGKGAFSTVYKGRHRLTGNVVAIKVFNDSDDAMAARFAHTIKCFEKIARRMNKSSAVISETSSQTGANAARWSPMTQHTVIPDSIVSEITSIRNDSMRSLAAASYRPSKELAHVLRLALITKELVVSLLDYSRSADGKPGKENGQYYVVMELGDYSLEDYIEARARSKQPFTVEEVRSILYDISRVVCLLHAQGLAHLDIKPANIMLFNSTFWKLIDFDGCFYSSSVVDVLESDIAFTPLYCPPEIAEAIVAGADHLKISRLMDVWSIGMIGMELVAMKPVLEERFLTLYDNEKQDDTRFLQWLCSKDSTIDMSTVAGFDATLEQLVREMVLVKDHTKRASLPEILQHPFFSSSPPAKKTWGTTAVTTRSFTHSASLGRTLPIKTHGLRLDASNPLESDDSAAFMHDESLDDEQPHGLDVSPDDIGPPISPKNYPAEPSLLDWLCCRNN